MLGKLLLTITLGTLLLCHGMLGFVHQVSCHGACLHTGAPPAYEHAASGASGHGDGEQEGGYAPTGYFAALLVLLAAAVLGLLLGARRRPEIANLRSFRPRSLLVSARLRRGPTSPFLQAFRL